MRALTLSLLLVCACGGEDHVLYVEVRTDLDPGGDFETVRVEVVEEISGGGTRRPMTVLFSPETTTDFAGGARVADFDMGSTGTWFVRADLLDPLNAPVRSGTSRVTVRGTTTVTIVLDRASDTDAGTDGGLPPDAGTADAGSDGGREDGGRMDAGVRDAGPRPGDSGPDSCPSCAEFCTTVATNCAGSDRVYSDEAECRTECEAFACGMRGETTGDTRACRLYHAGAAAADPRTHCPHAGPSGGGVCS